MKLPANARDLIATAEGHGWKTQLLEDTDGTFVYRYDDGSERTFEDVPTFVVSIWDGDDGNMLIQAGWIKNPVTNRWMNAQHKPVLARTMRDSEFPDAVTAALNRALGNDIVHWTFQSVKGLADWLISQGDPETAVAEVNTWT
jgi:hypothetical protein